MAESRANPAVEVNFDGLVGPTHNYAGLSLGNRASMGNAGKVSSPRRAAKQGLQKMRLLLDLGLTQGVLPPQLRPDSVILTKLGFEPETNLEQLNRQAPGLLAMVMSASPMWAANAATVSPSADSSDGRVHITPANLSSTAHRSFEWRQTTHILKTIFDDAPHFEVHQALPEASPFADEGAANHGRLASAHGQPGTQLFVYGRDGDDPIAAGTFPRRQTRLAGELIARSHGLDPGRVVFARQSAAAIDAGAFHNDVVSVVNQNVVFTHELAFDDSARLQAELNRHQAVRFVEVAEQEVPLADAISSYLFNSQLITLPDGSMTLIAPGEVDETPSTAAYLAAAIVDADNPIASVHSLDLRESMHNGGGPACLRLRVVLTEAELAAVAGRAIVDAELLDELEAWVDHHYREELAPEDLADPALVTETEAALDELTSILQLGSLYNFQH
ncbi:MAG: N-succinylarginine dihydrolase [Acidimicrobiales bacterium]